MINVNKKSSTQQLDEVKQGDIIKDETGKIGEVENIEVISRKMKHNITIRLKTTGRF